MWWVWPRVSVHAVWRYGVTKIMWPRPAENVFQRWNVCSSVRQRPLRDRTTNFWSFIYSHQTWNWVSGSFGSSFTSGSSFWLGVRPEFSRFSKKNQDIFVKIRPTVIKILAFNKWSSKFYFSEACSVQTPNSDRNWQTSCPLQTFVCNISRHLEFIIEQGLRVAGTQNVTKFHVWQPISPANLVKIGPVDVEIIGMTEIDKYFFK